MPSADYSNSLVLVDHPILRDWLTVLRDKTTDSATFRGYIFEITRMLAFEASRDLATEVVEIETPLAKTSAHRVSETPLVVSIMRAGNAMLDAVLSVMPFAAAGHIGIYRDKFINNTVEYYLKLPEDAKGRRTYVVDPLLGTGDTAIACIDRLNNYELGSITFICLLCSKPGLDKLFHFHPNVKVYALAVEPQLNDAGYLVPGLGDIGGRLYGSL
jgi:uracil phosphoribosyltransferase